MEIDRVDFVQSGAVPGAKILLAKSQRIPAPDLSEQPFRPVTPPPFGLVNLDPSALERKRFEMNAISAALVGATGKARRELQERLRQVMAEIAFLRQTSATAEELLSAGSGAQSMAEQAAGQRRSGIGVDNGTTTWDGQSIRINADGSKTKVTTTKAVTKANIADMLRSSRIAKQMSQSALAKAADISERSVKAHESGEATPSPLVAFRLASALDMDIEQREAFAAALRELRARA